MAAEPPGATPRPLQSADDTRVLEQRLTQVERRLTDEYTAMRDELSEIRSGLEKQRAVDLAGSGVPAPVLSGPRTCPRCSAELLPRARFCVVCGARTEPAWRPVVPAPPQAAPVAEHPLPGAWPPTQPVHAAAAPRAATPTPESAGASRVSFSSGPTQPAAGSARELRTRLRDRIPPITTTRLLAWVGGVIAVLGVTFLFVYAASRGWFVPPLRLAVGVLVSSGLLGFAVWFHHSRGGRYEAVLSAAGAGIAGLYATLFAASEVYGYLTRPAALVAAGLIALVATLVALTVGSEPLAIFGVCAAILAPLLIAREVTPLGLAFGALIGSVGLVCMIRSRWAWLTASVLAVSFPQVLVIASVKGPGYGLWTLGPLLFAVLWAATMYVRGLRPAPPRRLDQLTATLASVVASTLGVTAFQAGRGDEMFGHAANGVLLLGVAMVLMACAFLPWVIHRPHADLADLLGAYSLTALALAIGLLLRDSALVCGWAVEAGALALVAWRMRLRAGPGEDAARARADRMYAGATVYLVPALAALGYAAPPRLFASIADWASHSGLIGLIGLTVGAAVWAAVAISIEDWRDDRRWAAALPMAVAAYAVPFFVGGEWVIVTWSAMVVALAGVLVEPHARRVFGQTQLLVYATALLALGAGPTLHEFAWIGHAVEIAAWGSHDGLLPLGSLLVATAAVAGALLWVDVRAAGWIVAAPVAVLAYAMTFAVSGEWVIVSWSVMVVALAGALASARARRLIGQSELAVQGAALLALAAGVTVHHFATLADLTDMSRWGGHQGLVALTGAFIAAAILAGVVVLRTTVVLREWATLAPVAALVYLVAFALSGDAAIVTWSAIAALIAVPLYAAKMRELLCEAPLFVEATSVLSLATAVAVAHDRLAWQLVHHGEHQGVVVAVCLTAAAAVIVFGVRDLYRRAVAFRGPIVLACAALATILSDAWAVAGWALVPALIAFGVQTGPARFGRIMDIRVSLESATWLTALVATVGISFYETPVRLFHVNPSPATGIVALLAATAVAWLIATAVRTAGCTLRPFAVTPARIAIAASVLSLWSVTAVLLGLAELQPPGVGDGQVERHFQQGQVAVSVTWGLTGLLLLYLGFRQRSQALRTAGVVLLFVTPAKLVLYDLAFLPASARAASFIITGIALIGAALLMQRLGGQDPHDRGGTGAPRPTAGVGPPAAGAV